MKLVYAEQAVTDLGCLRAFIAEKDSSAAARVGLELIERFEYIRRFPLMGRAVALAPDPDSLRDAIFGKYVVRYSVHAETVVILRVWHHYEHRE